MNELFIDIETSGLPQYDNGNIPHFKNLKKFNNCRMLEICMILFENKKLSSFYHKIVKVDFDIENSEIHGITNEISREKGVLIENIYHDILHYINKSDIIIAHNIVFDLSCIFSELYRIDNDVNIINFINSKIFICTMLSSIDICKIKPVNFFEQYKYPKLDELYFYFFKSDRKNKHTAKSDTVDLVKCYNELSKLNIKFIFINKYFKNP
jgi:DNA polymerase III epsilon subunit-like protein